MRELSFRLDVRNPERRRIEVVLEVEVGESGQPTEPEFFLPTWTPGSYLVREYSRHLGPVEARDGRTGRELRCGKTRKNRFRVELPPGTAHLRLAYSVYAHELTVRTADVTPEHAFWNHACVLLWPVGDANLPARIAVRFPPSWDLACALPQERCAPGEVILRASDHDAAIDAPCLVGRFERLDWQVRGVPHAFVLDGLGPVRPPGHFVADLTKLVEHAADVFGEIPYPRFLFLGLFSEAGHGGLEHADSATLLGPRTALHPGKSYREFLGLCAHELLHAWNVKRMRPVEFWTYDYEHENYSPMLWLAEGFTAYYDDLLCRRSGLLTIDAYLEIVARNLANLWNAPGRFRQSLAEASFDAWIRLYRPDENTRNSTQNYYGNGALAALVLDLSIRRTSAGRGDLDTALRSLYRNTWLERRGYRREDVERCLSEAAGVDLSGLLATLVDGPLDPGFRGLFADFGIELVQKERDRPYLGLSFQTDKMVVATVSDDGPALVSGIAPTDEVLAFAGVRVAVDNWRDVLRTVARVGQPLRVLTASRGLIVERTLIPGPAPVGTVSLILVDNATAEQARLRDAWLWAHVGASTAPA